MPSSRCRFAAAVDTAVAGLYPSHVTRDRKTRHLLILNVLKNAGEPLSSAKISEELASLGQQMSERTVRLYLQGMDREGLTRGAGRAGHAITDRGLAEVHSTSVVDRVGFLSARMDRLTYLMDFDLLNRSGNVVVNLTTVAPAELAGRVDLICQVYEKGYAMGRLIALFGPGEGVDYRTVPEGMVGVGTICSVTLNGVLLKHGIPTSSRFGGLLELMGGKPTRLVEIITYDGTTVDPLEVFISSGMTDYVGAVRTGNGRIGVGFREFPAESRERVEDLAGKLERIGLGGFMRIGRRSQPLLDIPVSEGRIGAIVIGGLNPVSILEETGLRLRSHALAGLADFNRFFSYQELGSRLKAYL